MVILGIRTLLARRRAAIDAPRCDEPAPSSHVSPQLGDSMRQRAAAVTPTMSVSATFLQSRLCSLLGLGTSLRCRYQWRSVGVLFSRPAKIAQAEEPGPGGSPSLMLTTRRPPSRRHPACDHPGVRGPAPITLMPLPETSGEAVQRGPLPGDTPDSVIWRPF
jgi:hypothetical protein